MFVCLCPVPMLPTPAFAKASARQLSLCENWWAGLDSNQGPRPYQGRALTN